MHANALSREHHVPYLENKSVLKTARYYGCMAYEVSIVFLFKANYCMTQVYSITI